jgi:hypothetical protein
MSMYIVQDVERKMSSVSVLNLSFMRVYWSIRTYMVHVNT